MPTPEEQRMLSSIATYLREIKNELHLMNEKLERLIEGETGAKPPSPPRPKPRG